MDYIKVGFGVNGVNVEEICKERIKMWMGKMVEVNATPVLMVGVGHGGPCGRVIVCALDDVSDDMMAFFLREALNQIELKK